MTALVSDFILERLKQWGVYRIYGYSGDSINPLMSALDRDQQGSNDDAMEFIPVRHEEMAAFMACAHAKFTGDVGVCVASAGPGAIHLINGLYDAKMDHQPVVAIVGQLPRASMGTYYQQEVDLQTVLKDVAGDYIQVMNDPSQARHLVDQAVRIAKAESTVTCLILPHDVQAMPAVKRPKQSHHYTVSGISDATPRMIPTERELRKAAAVLNEGKRVAMLVGAGALGAVNEVLATAELLGAGIAKALLGLAVIPAEVPYCTGSIGLLGTRPSWELMNQCDTLLMVGSDFPYAEFLPKEGHARGVQIDVRPRKLSMRYPMEVNLAGDARETLQALLPMLQPKGDRRWQTQISRSVRDWQTLVEKRAKLEAGPINPQYAFRELFNQLPDEAIVTADTGTSTVWMAQYHRFRRGMMFSASGRLASMGAGVPYAIAAKFAFPNRPVVAVVGDGAMQMNGNGELVTIARHWQEWEDPRLVIMVLNNGELDFVSWEMRVMDGDRKYPTSQDLPGFPYAQYAASIGLRGIKVSDPAMLSQAWHDALHSDKPCVLEIVTNPNVPPLPPHISIKQARHFAQAMLKGDSESLEIIRLSFAQMAVW